MSDEAQHVERGAWLSVGSSFVVSRLVLQRVSVSGSRAEQECHPLQGFAGLTAILTLMTLIAFVTMTRIPVEDSSRRSRTGVSNMLWPAC